MTPAELSARLAAVASRALQQECRIDGLTRLSGGASAQTWTFDLQQASHTLPCILRRSATSERNRFATSVSKALEAQLQRLARAQGVPAPQILFELDPADALGEGYVMTRIAGETLAPKILLRPDLETARHHLAAQCGTILANIHRVDVHSLHDQLPDQSALPQLNQLDALYRSFDQPQPVFEYALRWLREHAPAPTRLTLVHGDFRNGNFVVDETGIAAVLDWELAHRGDPAEDIGWLCVRSWRFGKPHLAAGGFGTLDAVLHAYEQAGGGIITPAQVRYWQAFGTLRWGIICLFQVFSHLRGEQQSVELAAIGRRVSETEFDLMELLS